MGHVVLNVIALRWAASNHTCCQRSMTTRRSPWRFVPLAVVAVLHAMALSLMFSLLLGLIDKDAELSRFLTQTAHDIGVVQFPILLSMIAVWLAVQPVFWRKLPWAIIAATGCLALFMVSPRTWNFEILCRATALLLGAIILCAVTRCFLRFPPRKVSRQLGLQDLLLWITAIAVTIAAIRSSPFEFLPAIRQLEQFGWHNLTFYLLLGAEYLLLAQLLVIMVMRRRLLWWIVPYVLVVFPLVLLLESWLTTLLLGGPMYFDPEAWGYAGAQMIVLAITLLAWRYSGWLYEEPSPVADAASVGSDS